MVRRVAEAKNALHYVTLDRQPTPLEIVSKAVLGLAVHVRLMTQFG